MIKEILNFLDKKGVIIIWGVTATGKTELALELSKYLDVEIISADSRQIYKYMNIGTDKVELYRRKKIKHYLIDEIYPNERYNVALRREKTYKIIDDILSKGKRPIVVGGTGLYIDSIIKNFTIPNIEPNYNLRNYLELKEKEKPGILYEELKKIDPDEALKLHPNNKRYIIRALEIYYVSGVTKTQLIAMSKPKWNLNIIGLWREKEDTNQRINKRVKNMLKRGILEETKFILDLYGKDIPAFETIGYKECLGYLNGEYDYEYLEYKLKKNTHYYAKKQRTWFRRYIKDKTLNQIIFNLTTGNKI